MPACSPVLDIGAACEGMADNQTVVCLGVELAPGLVRHWDLFQLDARLEGERREDGDLLLDKI